MIIIAFECIHTQFQKRLEGTLLRMFKAEIVNRVKNLAQNTDVLRKEG